MLPTIYGKKCSGYPINFENVEQYLTAKNNACQRNLLSKLLHLRGEGDIHLSVNHSNDLLNRSNPHFTAKIDQTIGHSAFSSELRCD